MMIETADYTDVVCLQHTLLIHSV